MIEVIFEIIWIIFTEILIKLKLLLLLHRINILDVRGLDFR